MKGNLLIVDDEVGVRESLNRYFQQLNYQVDTVSDGEDAIKVLKSRSIDLVILDVNLGIDDGFEICQKIRELTGGGTGIILISGIKKDPFDQVVGLEVGADAYITKPFETRFLEAQVKAILRRIQSKRSGGTNMGWFVVDDYLKINFEKCKVQAGEIALDLSTREADMLKYLIQRAGKPCSRSDLIDEVWGYESGGDINDSAVNVFVFKLRKKIEQDPENPIYIQSVHGIGYRFKDL
jgi:DNA-binding response OmpR family regulator